MIVCFDLETTGLDRYNDKIIEIAMVKFDEKTFEGLLCIRFSSYCHHSSPWYRPNNPHPCPLPLDPSLDHRTLE